MIMLNNHAGPDKDRSETNVTLTPLLILNGVRVTFVLDRSLA